MVFQAMRRVRPTGKLREMQRDEWQYGQQRLIRNGGNRTETRSSSDGSPHGRQEFQVRAKAMFKIHVQVKKAEGKRRRWRGKHHGVTREKVSMM